MIVPVWWRVEGLTPSSNIGCRLIMFATPLLLETTAVGRVQNPAYRVSGNKNRAIRFRCCYSETHRARFLLKVQNRIVIPATAPGSRFIKKHAHIMRDIIMT